MNQLQLKLVHQLHISAVKPFFLKEKVELAIKRNINLSLFTYSMQTLKEYQEMVYKTFYTKEELSTEQRAHLPRIDDAISLYNSFFERFYRGRNGNVSEAALVSEFMDFMHNLTGKPHYIFVTHRKDPFSSGHEGALWDINKCLSRNGQNLLWQVYEIELLHNNRGDIYNSEITLSHELIHIIEIVLKNNTGTK